jgi:hypothetical protein
VFGISPVKIVRELRSGGTRNPLLNSKACLSHSDPYERSWLYTACGEPEPGHLDVHGYIA